jgi:ribonuclease PH
MRPSRRKYNELRDIKIETMISKYAEGSCLVSFGDTQVMCTATVDESIPNFLRGKNKGWITAEYSMLPRSTHHRMKRDIQMGKPSGRSQEIQRLIARSLRSIVDLSVLGERQIIVDCDVIQADGGTRTASITGGYVALYLACKNLLKRNVISRIPIYTEVAAVSCGIYDSQVILDLDYDEDSEAEVDANFVMTTHGSIIEIQGTAEKDPFNKQQLLEMLALAEHGIKDLTKLQRQAVS